MPISPRQEQLVLPQDAIVVRRYGDLLRYLESLEFVDAVAVAQLRGTRLNLLVSTRAAPEQLLGLLEADRQLFNDQLAIAEQADLRLVWRRR